MRFTNLIFAIRVIRAILALPQSTKWETRCCQDLQALHEDVDGRRGEVEVVFEQVRLDAVEDVRREGVAEVVDNARGEGAHSLSLIHI